MPPKVSIIMCAYNEEKFVKSSIESIRASISYPHEFIFIDDHSTDRTLNIVAEMPDIIIDQPDKRSGVAMCRELGYSWAKGDIIMFFDAHVWITMRHSFDVLIKEAENHEALIVPSFSFIKEENGKLPDVFPSDDFKTNYGSGLSFCFKRYWFYLNVDRRRRVYLRPRFAFHAPGATCTREVYDKVRGWTPLPGFWGGNDALFSIKLFMMNIPILSIPSAHLFHFAKRFSARQMPSAHEAVNRVLGARLSFSDEMFQDFWLPAFEARYSGRMQDGSMDINEPWILKERDKILQNYTRPESEFMEEFVTREWNIYKEEGKDRDVTVREGKK